MFRNIIFGVVMLGIYEIHMKSIAEDSHRTIYNGTAYGDEFCGLSYDAFSI
jgi:hypothetical protein